MALYWFVFLLPMCMALANARPVSSSAFKVSNSTTLPWVLFSVLLIFMIGLRHKVGADWWAYLDHYERAASLDFSQILQQPDPAHYALNWLSAQVDWGVYGTNTFAAVIFVWGLARFCLHLSRPWLAMVVAVPYLVIVVAMGYSRQAVALGLVMSALVHQAQGRFLRFLLGVAFAAAFHKTAVLLFGLVLLGKGSKWRSIFAVLPVALALYFAFLDQHVDSLQSGYLAVQYASDGALIRLLLNAVPAAILIIYRRRFADLWSQSFWRWSAISSLLLLGALAVSSSSTAVDRIGLYFLPLQLVVFAQLPNALASSPRARSLWLAAIVFLYAAILFVWLNFAAHAFAWVPYRSFFLLHL